MRIKKLKKIIEETIKEFIMETKIYSIKDTVTGNFSALTTSPIDGVVLRELTNLMETKDKNNELYLNRADKQLYCLGSYDYDTGVIKSEVRFVTNLIDLSKED